MTPDQLSRTVLHVLRRVIEDGALRLDPVALPERVTVESPPRRGVGDYAVSAAFPVAKAVGRSPGEVAELLRGYLWTQPGIAGADIAGAGFLNVTLTGRARASLVRELADGTGEAAGRDDEPAADIAHWAGATGEDPAVLAARNESSSLFRVQYAHARARALLRNGCELGCAPEAGDGPYDGPSERALIARLADHARLAGPARNTGTPTPGRTGHRGGPRDAGRAHARHLEAVSGAFFDFHDAHPPLPSGDEKPGAAHRTRLALAAATGTVLAGGLSQLGVTAPAHL